MEDQEWTEPSDPQDKDANKQSRWSEHCKTFIIRDAHGAIKELVFPRALDLDRPKRERTIFSSRQLGCLEDEFKQNQYLVGKERSTVAKRLGLSETQVKVWFQNRRTKHKKDNERCGDGKDFLAERKAARNVLKLLEYKTALNYSTFLTPTPTHLDTHRSLPTSTMDYVGGQSSNITNDHKEKMLDMNLKQAEILLDHSSLEIPDVGFESRHKKDIETAGLQVTIESVLSKRDAIVKDIPVDTGSKCSPVSSSSESFQNSSSTLLSLDVDDYPDADRDVGKTSGGLGSAHLKSTDFVNNKRLQLNSSLCLDNMLKHPGIQINNIASGDVSLCDSANADEYILSAKEKLNEEIRTRMQNKKQGNTDLSSVCTRFHPYPRFKHCTEDTSQDTWGNEDHVHTVDNTGCRRPSLFSEGCVLENNTFLDGRSAHNITSTIAASREMHGGILTNSYSNRSIGNYLSNLMNGPSSIHNTYFPYQTTMITPGQGSHYQHQFPYTNMKHYNNYVPHFYGPGVNETSPPLQILQHAPVCNAYGDGRQQRSYASYAMSTPQTSFLSQTTVHGLPSQHQGYHLGTPFS